MDLNTITPHLVVNDGEAAISFYEKAFGAELICKLPLPDGRIMHAALQIGNSTLFLCDDFPEYCGGNHRSAKSLGGSPVTIHLQVPDVDQAFDKAVRAGATVTMPVADMFWGDRYGCVDDPFGHKWSLATKVKEVTPEEMEKAALAFA